MIDAEPRTIRRDKEFDLDPNPRFSDVAGMLPMAHFIRLQAELPGAKTYTRTITGVVRQARGENRNQVGMVRYEPQDGLRFDDPGEIATNWLNDPVAQLVCQLAKDFCGHRCLLFQINKHQSDENPMGFRELIWIHRLDGVD